MNDKFTAPEVITWTNKGKSKNAGSSVPSSSRSGWTDDEDDNDEHVASFAEKKSDDSFSALASINHKASKKMMSKLDSETHVVEENQDEESDTEWDATCWDDPSINLPSIPFYDEKENKYGPRPVFLIAKRLEAMMNQTVAFTSKRLNCETTDTQLAPNGEESESSTWDDPKVNLPTVPAFDEEGNAYEPTRLFLINDGRKKTVKQPDIAPMLDEGNLRSPICCIMGHLDTSKTKLLDCIRHTNVQEGETWGITEQIGATYFSAKYFRDRFKELKLTIQLDVPGLLVIDTPGDELFRSPGSGLCDIAILVVDIMHGLQPETIESLNLLWKPPLKKQFVIALDNVDRLNGWKCCKNKFFQHAMREQSEGVRNEFCSRLARVIEQFKEHGLKTVFYLKNRLMTEAVCIVPTSAISGVGIPDLLLLLVLWAEKTVKLAYSYKVQCTVLEVKFIEGHGTTIDVLLVNGALREGDQIVVSGMQGPIVTRIRALLTPHPMKEFRVNGTYLQHKEIKATQGIKISAEGLQYAVVGTRLHVVDPNDDLEEVKAAMKPYNL